MNERVGPVGSESAVDLIKSQTPLGQRLHDRFWTRVYEGGGERVYLAGVTAVGLAGLAVLWL